MRLFEAIIEGSHRATSGDLGMLAQFHSGGSSSDTPAFVQLFFVLFVIAFVVIVGSMILRIGKGVSEWSNNNEQPVLTVAAKVAAKRTEMSVYSNRSGGNNLGTSSSTDYYATFEFSSGDRTEFGLSASEYGLLSENDVGHLTFQGTRFKSFQRSSAVQNNPPSEPVAATVSAPAQTAPEPQDSAHSFCPYCGVAIEGTFKFCPHCGKEQPVYDANT